MSLGNHDCSMPNAGEIMINWQINVKFLLFFTNEWEHMENMGTHLNIKQITNCAQLSQSGANETLTSLVDCRKNERFVLK
jgi:hypothetical protein